MEIQRCKGSRDLLPEDMARFRYIEGIFRSRCSGWGYRETRTPTLEYLHLFTSTGTLAPNMLSRVYSFLDWDGWSGERVALRPDSTIPAARLYIQNVSPVRPAKLFYVQNVFSFEETGKESRERWQCGAEMIGGAGPAADVELITLGLEVLGKLGFSDVQLHLSHAGVIRAVLNELGLTPARYSEVFHRILDGDAEMFSRIVSAQPQLGDTLSLLFEAKGRSVGFLQNLKASLARTLSSDSMQASMDDLTDIARRLSEMGCQYQVDMTSARSFEYYTGVIFRFYVGGEKVGGGGRYDDLIPLLGGGDVSASGFALRLDQLMGLVEGWQDNRARILVRGQGKIANAARICFETADMLRKAGYVAELDQGCAGTTDHEWVLSVRGTQKKPSFALTDRSGGRVIKASSSAEVLDALQAADASKASSS